MKKNKLGAELQLFATAAKKFFFSKNEGVMS